MTTKHEELLNHLTDIKVDIAIMMSDVRRINGTIKKHDKQIDEHHDFITSLKTKITMIVTGATALFSIIFIYIKKLTGG